MRDLRKAENKYKNKIDSDKENPRGGQSRGGGLWDTLENIEIEEEQK